MKFSSNTQIKIPLKKDLVVMRMLHIKVDEIKIPEKI